MSDFAEARAGLHEAVFDRLGEAATWNGDPVRIRIETPDLSAGWSEAPVIQPGVIIKVRRAEVPNPQLGAEVIWGTRTFVLSGSEPMRDASGEIWTCEAQEVV